MLLRRRKKTKKKKEIKHPTTANAFLGFQINQGERAGIYVVNSC